MLPQEAYRLLAELVDPRFRERLDAAACILNDSCRSIQQITLGVLDVPREGFDLMMETQGSELLPHLIQAATVHQEFARALDRLTEAMEARQAAPKSM